MRTGTKLNDCTTVVLAVAALTTCLLAVTVRRAAAQFTSGVNIVEVYATVTDRSGEPLTGLAQTDFSVSEDGAPQQITAFAAAEFPLSVAIAIDRSFSMKGDRLRAAKSAARAFVDALRPSDQVAVVAVGSETEVVAPLSTDHEATIAAISRLDAWGTTSLYDSMLVAIDAIQPAQGRRALVLLSDGVDRFSKATANDVIEHARRQDVLLYPVAIGKLRPPLFAELAAVTGGRSFFLNDIGQLERTLAAVARELRFQYLLGYTPRRDVSPGWHTIAVRVDRPNVVVRARDAYFAPPR